MIQRPDRLTRCVFAGLAFALASCMGQRLESSTTSPPPAVTTGELAGDRDWRIVAEGVNTGEEGVQVALDSAAFAEHFAATDIGPLPSIDFDRELVIFLNPIVSAACPALELTGLHLDVPSRLIFGVYGTPGSRTNCSDRAGAHLFVVAVLRSALPQGHMTVRTMEEYQLCADCGRSVEEASFEIGP